MAGATATRSKRWTPPPKEQMPRDHPLILAVQEVRQKAGRPSDECLDGMEVEEARLCERIADMVTVLGNPKSRYYPKTDDDYAAKVTKLTEMEDRQQAMRESLILSGRKPTAWFCKCGARTLFYTGKCADCINKEIGGAEK